MNAPTITQEQIELFIKLNGIFSPSARAKRDVVYDDRDSARFVHYTSAEAALSIIQTKRLWMRNTTCMTDYREVQHGYDLLNQFFSNKEKNGEFVNALDLCSPNTGEKGIGLFNQWWADIRFNTFLASFSEHDDTENSHGRLSMWRAFGGNSARVAIVLNIPRTGSLTRPLHITFNPVTYPKENDINAEIDQVISNVKSNRDFLKTVEPDMLINHVFNMLVTNVTCLKHEGFKEEREWRAIYSPNRWASFATERAVETIGGIPQVVYKLALDKNVSEDIAYLDFARLFERLIIGPTQYPSAQKNAFVVALKDAGVRDAEERVFPSGIPIRT